MRRASAARAAWATSRFSTSWIRFAKAGVGNATRWSVRQMGQQAGASPATCSASGMRLVFEQVLEPHLQEIFRPWLQRSAPTSVAQLRQAIRDHIGLHNKEPQALCVAQKSPDTILASVARAAGSMSRSLLLRRHSYND